MIDRTAVRRLTLVSAIMFLLAAVLALSIWRSLPLAGGIGLGFVLGIAPFLSWAWLVWGGLGTLRRRVLAVVLVLAKLALYAGALYLLVTREIVDPVGVLVGITLVVFTLAGGALLTPSQAREVRP